MHTRFSCFFRSVIIRFTLREKLSVYLDHVTIRWQSGHPACLKAPLQQPFAGFIKLYAS